MTAWSKSVSEWCRYRDPQYASLISFVVYSPLIVLERCTTSRGLDRLMSRNSLTADNARHTRTDWRRRKPRAVCFYNQPLVLVHYEGNNTATYSINLTNMLECCLLPTTSAPMLNTALIRVWRTSPTWGMLSKTLDYECITHSRDNSRSDLERAVTLAWRRSLCRDIYLHKYLMW